MPRLIRLSLLVCLSVALSWGLTPAHAKPNGLADRDFSVTAHRGGPTKAYGENTLPAFRNAIRSGATAIETDLRRTKDDEIVVLHDSGVGRTTSCGGPIGHWTLAQLDRQCREKTTRRPVPHLADLLDFAVHHHKVTLLLELKGSNWTPLQLRRVIVPIREAGLESRVSVSSFRVRVLRRARHIAPRLGTQYIAPGWRAAQRTRLQVDGFNLPASELTKERVALLHERGLVVVGSSTSRPREWRQLLRVGVDGLVLSRVVAYRRWLKANG